MDINMNINNEHMDYLDDIVDYMWITEFKDDCDDADLKYTYVLDLIDNKGLRKNMYHMFINILGKERWKYGPYYDTRNK